jgi:hypothetical protein
MTIATALLSKCSKLLERGVGELEHGSTGAWEHEQLNPENPLLGALSCRFLIRGEPPNKNAAKPSGNPTLATASPPGDARIRKSSKSRSKINGSLLQTRLFEQSGLCPEQHGSCINHLNLLTYSKHFLQLFVRLYILSLLLAPLYFQQRSVLWDRC